MIIPITVGRGLCSPVDRGVLCLAPPGARDATLGPQAVL